MTKTLRTEETRPKRAAAAPGVWGPTFWKVIHSSSFTSSPTAFSSLMEALVKSLPCADCRLSLKYYCEIWPLAAMMNDPDAEAIPKWAWYIHKSVNEKLRKQNLEYEILKRRVLVFGAAVTKEDVFGMIFLIALQHNPVVYDVATALANAFPAECFAPHLLRTDKLHSDPFTHFSLLYRQLCVQMQCPLMTTDQIRHHCDAASVQYVPPLKP